MARLAGGGATVSYDPGTDRRAPESTAPTFDKHAFKENAMQQHLLPEDTRAEVFDTVANRTDPTRRS
jgi:hypothetical protein